MKRFLLLCIILTVAINAAQAQSTRSLYPPTDLVGSNPWGTDYVALSWSAPVDSTTLLTPENLLGYNIYRDSTLIGFTDTTVYYDLNPILEFMTDYHVSALYDLAGGETGESTWAGPVSVLVTMGLFELPFYETFTTGSFETNMWEVEEGNWQIAGQEGNIAPAVRFNNYPLIENYSKTLVSHWLRATDYVNGNLYIDFSLKLTTVNQDSTESLYIDVYNGTDWVTEKVYKNIQSFDWTNEHIDITEAAYGMLFKIRFRAEGANSENIQSWLIDNIRVYRSCPVIELMGDATTIDDSCFMKLEWHQPVLNSFSEVTGYNIYRDGQLLQSTTDTIYFDPLDPYIGYCYRVTVMYSDCESDFSNSVCAIISKDPCPIKASSEDIGLGNVYPNPAKSWVTLDIKAGVSKVEIYNLLGNRIHTIKSNGTDQQIPLNVRNWKKGIYLIKYTTIKGTSHARKLVVN